MDKTLVRNLDPILVINCIALEGESHLFSVCRKLIKLDDSGVSDTYSYLLGEPLVEYHKIKTIKTLNIYILAYRAIIRSYMKQFHC